MLTYGISRALRQLGLAVVLASAGGTAFADQIKIAALGDSLTQGFGLAPDDGLVPQLQRWLGQNGQDAVVIVNAGVSGDTTAGGLARIAWTLESDTDGLIVALGGNDMLRGIDPAVSEANLAGILDAARAKDLPVLLVGMESAGNYGPEYKTAFDGMYPALAERYQTRLFPSLLRPVAAASDGLGPLDPSLMQSDGTHPSREGVARIVDALGPSVSALIDDIRNDS